jgi:disulfide oxidoreductase YuzD
VLLIPSPYGENPPRDEQQRPVHRPLINYLYPFLLFKIIVIERGNNTLKDVTGKKKMKKERPVFPD